MIPPAETPVNGEDQKAAQLKIHQQVLATEMSKLSRPQSLKCVTIIAVVDKQTESRETEDPLWVNLC